MTSITTKNQPASDAVSGGEPLSRGSKALHWLLLIMMGAGIIALYNSLGSSSNTSVEPRSIFRWIWIQWRYYEDLSNNWVMLLVSGYAIYSQRQALAEAPRKASAIGMLVALGSLALHILGYRTQLPRVSLITVVTLVWGISYALWGWQVAKILLFPAGYTLLCFNAYHLIHFTMSLRLMASALAETMLEGVGIETIRKGTVLVSSAGGGFQLDVADACSGLRSLIVMTALAAPYAYFTQKGFCRKWTLFLLSVPLAMLANALRIFTLAAVAEWIGMRLAMALYHDFSGYLVFIISIALLIGAGGILNKDWKSKWRKIRELSLSHT